MLAIANNADLLINKKAFLQFLLFWYRVKRYYFAILAYLQSIFLKNKNIISKNKQKTILKSAQAFKKIKFLNNLIIAKIAKIIALNNQKLIQQKKVNKKI